MTDKKPSTADIMAMLRKKPAAGVPTPAPDAAPAAPDAAAAEAVAPAAEAPAAPATPAAKPKGTSDIMAAIRAKGATPAAAAPAAAASAPASPPGAKPKGTSDIMAAIRAKGATPAAATAAVAPVAAAAAPKTAAPVSTGKSPAEMIQAMRANAAQASAGNHCRSGRSRDAEAPREALPRQPKAVQARNRNSHVAHSPVLCLRHCLCRTTWPGPC